jgi:hypothetical protein
MICVEDKIFPNYISKTDRYRIIANLIQSPEWSCQIVEENNTGNKYIDMKCTSDEFLRDHLRKAASRLGIKWRKIPGYEKRARTQIDKIPTRAYDLWSGKKLSDEEKVEMVNSLIGTFNNGVIAFYEHYDPERI